MKSTLTKLRKCGISPNNWRMDHPKRAGLKQRKFKFSFSLTSFLTECRNQKGCASYYGCDICTRRATYYQAQEDPTDKRKKIKGSVMVYPAGIEETNLRNHDRHLELADRARPREDEQHEYYGVKSGRPFLTKIFPNMDIVRDIVVDWMHLVCEGKARLSNWNYKNFNFSPLFLGTVQKSYQFTFKGSSMQRYLDMFSEGYQKIKVPSEFPRRTRHPHPAVLKASEWRTISIAAFVLFAKVFGDSKHAPKRYFWLLQVNGTNNFKI